MTVLSCISQCVAQNHSAVLLQQRSILLGQQLYHFRVTQEGGDLQGDESLTLEGLGSSDIETTGCDTSPYYSPTSALILGAATPGETFHEAGNYVIKGTHLI